MNSFPKKYNPKDLYHRSKKYREENNKEKKESSSTVFSPSILPCSKKLSYRDFFSIYLKDFFNYNFFKENFEESKYSENSYKQLFLTYRNQLENISSCYDFFLKRHQTLLQIGPEKLERRIISSTKKYLNANLKILDSYTSDNHKIYIPDSDLYIYILEQLHSLREQGKITNETKIGYRSFNLQTSIPQEKISRRDEKIHYYTLKYFIGTKGEALYVGMEGDIDVCCGDVALLVHPKDKRYNKYIGKKAIIPLCNRLIPIIGDESVNIAENNGVKRVCPFAEEESIYLAKKYGLPTNIYVFNREGLYTEYIHEQAFIGKERKKYYNNILEFIENIGNMGELGEKISKVPYLEEINERLTPYKLDQLTIDLTEEKQKIINQIFEHNIKYPQLDSKITKFIEELDFKEPENSEISELNMENDESLNDKNIKEIKIKQKISTELDEYLPNNIICNSQIPFGWKIPLLKDNEGTLSFFDLEKNCVTRKEKPLQFCFNFVLLSLIRAGTILVKENGNGENKVGEYNKLSIKFAENEKKIKYLVQYLSKLTGEKPEYNNFLHIIENLTDENSPTLKDFQNLLKNCKYLTIEGNQINTNITGIVKDTINPDLIELCIPCYLKNKGIKLNPLAIFSKDEKMKTFKELLIQELLLGENITNTLMEYSYNENNEFLGDKQLTKLQINQIQRDIFSLYGENPVRLSLLINQTFNQKEILLNNIFLKQIWNAVRLCIQKNFLPKDIKKCLEDQPKDFEDFDICVLEKLNELYDIRLNIKTYEEYTNFFNIFKESIQNTFFSRYLEILKVHNTQNSQFVCSYFFNLILTVLYPAVPEFVDALQYISGKEFIFSFIPIKLEKTTDYNMNILYNTFIKIKQMKIENNIKQHESCNIFIKSTPTIGDIFSKNEQIFKNYFHISEINYIRLHEANPLGYEIISSNNDITIGIQPGKSQNVKDKDSIENIEKEIKNLDDKLNLLRQRIQILPEGEQRSKTEEEYAKTKEEIENLTIKYSLLNSK